jgi:osmotically-inducible protein OsmY
MKTSDIPGHPLSKVWDNESQPAFDQKDQNRMAVMPDADQIKRDIKKVLKASGCKNASTIIVEADKHDILLKGIVNSWDLRAAIAHVAWSAPGVNKINDQIYIVEDKGE